MIREQSSDSDVKSWRSQESFSICTREKLFSTSFLLMFNVSERSEMLLNILQQLGVLFVLSRLVGSLVSCHGMSFNLIENSPSTFRRLARYGAHWVIGERERQSNSQIPFSQRYRMIKKENVVVSSVLMTRHNPSNLTRLTPIEFSFNGNIFLFRSLEKSLFLVNVSFVIVIGCFQ